jgi:rhodanese-related sulfurtransferase
VKALRQIIGEAVGLALAGGLLGLAVNALLPRGLHLTRDYFPEVTTTLVAPGTPTAHEAVSVPRPEVAGATNAVAADDHALPTQPTSATNALLLIGFDKALALYQDPRREADLILFVDARNAKAYAAGHIPGSYRFDHYHPEEGMAEVLPLCQAADVVVVYCNGGDCEDSRLTAHTLQELGVPPDHLWVYQGGLAEWRARGQPVETGPRLSGLLLSPDQP